MGFSPTEMVIVLMIVGGWVLPAVAVGVWAGRAGRGFLPAFLLSLFASPVVGAIYVVAATTPRRSAPGRDVRR